MAATSKRQRWGTRALGLTRLPSLSLSRTDTLRGALAPALPLTLALALALALTRARDAPAHDGDPEHTHTHTYTHTHARTHKGQV